MRRAAGAAKWAGAPSRSARRDRRADLLRRGLAAERGAEPDDHDRLDRARKAAQQWQPPRTQPQRLRDISPAEPRQPDRADAGDRTAAGQHEHPAGIRAAFDAFQEMAVLIRPREVLDGVQQPDQRRAADAGAHPDQHDQHPEARAVARDDPAAGTFGRAEETEAIPRSLTGAPGGRLPTASLQGFCDAGGGTRTPDTRIMIRAPQPRFWL